AGPTHPRGSRHLPGGLARARGKSKTGAGHRMDIQTGPCRVARRARSAGLIAAASVVSIARSACKSSGLGETTQHGYVVPELALEQIPPGSSRDQVLIALGP